jgi:ketosteroid isomerase-like protein
MGRLRPDRPPDATSACRRCQRPAPHLDSPPALYWELIAEDGEVVGVICPDCLTFREQRAIRAEKARIPRRLKRGLPSSWRGHAGRRDTGRAMSCENVELVRRADAVLNQALTTGEDVPMIPAIDAEIVVEMGALEGTFHGREGLKRFVEGQAAIIEGLRCDPDEIIDAGDRIVAPIRLSGRARNTGLPVEYHYAHVWTMRAGKVVRLRLHASKATALKAVGLRE